MNKNIIYVIVFFSILLSVIYIRETLYPPIYCNGSKTVCDKQLTDIAFLTSHNAMGIEGQGFFGPTQEKSITDQLDLGVRALMIDTHYFDAAESLESYFPEATPVEMMAMHVVVNKIGMQKREGTYSCHIICNIGYTPLVELFGEIKTFLDKNPHEVLMLLIEDKITTKDTVQAFTDSGLMSYIYTKDDQTSWPTLRKLISENKRLVVMAEVESPPPSWYYHMWDYVEETPYSFKDSSEMSCNINRGGTGKSFFLINNWIEKVVPRKEDAKQVNAYDFLINRIRKCETERGKKANFIGVNFSNLGDGAKVVKTLNGFE